MNRRSGYSIIEVLIAFAVMSMTLAVLLPGQTRLLGRAGDAAERALAQDYALSRLDLVRVLGAEAPASSYGNWRVSEDVAEGPAQRAVTVSVRSASGRLLAEVTRTYGVRDAE
ncbi:type IV pilus modification PilV family protein [Tateyamaria sp. SN3-11]|uniref:type IV pilus modification PilV family protein n=1 Tax=Tateyamaria sp. SN3-11 TaxID=3092147 RepID=UPI0039EA825A